MMSGHSRSGLESVVNFAKNLSSVSVLCNAPDVILGSGGNVALPFNRKAVVASRKSTMAFMPYRSVRGELDGVVSQPYGPLPIKALASLCNCFVATANKTQG